ncbi:hypothetical protein D3C81_1696410 [compost metagenome]
MGGGGKVFSSAAGGGLHRLHGHQQLALLRLQPEEGLPEGRRGRRPGEAPGQVHHRQHLPADVDQSEHRIGSAGEWRPQQSGQHTDDRVQAHRQMLPRQPERQHEISIHRGILLPLALAIKGSSGPACVQKKHGDIWITSYGLKGRTLRGSKARGVIRSGPARSRPKRIQALPEFPPRIFPRAKTNPRPA